MGAATSETRELGGERAQRIVEAMRASVARRGAAGSTFDHVAREAGVSRGLLHYHFGSKERLLLEVVRRDSAIRMERLGRALEGAGSADDIIDALLHSLEEVVSDDPGFVILHFELFTLARRNGEIAAEMAELGRRTRAHVAELLGRKQAEGVLRLGDEPEAVAGAVLALGDGLALRMLAEPDLDARPLLRAAVAAARALLAKPA
ncbi:MAG: TetR/AcrR family transcriptional regulator [Solirubrobacteraceae bacterium]